VIPPTLRSTERSRGQSCPNREVTMSLYQIKIKGTDVFKEVDSEKIDDALCAYIFQKGLDAVLGRGRAKLDSAKNFPSAEAYAAEATKIFDEQLAALYAGKTRMVGGTKKAKGADGALQTEMLRIAKIYAKEQVRAMGTVKVSKVSAAEWTRTAKAYIEADPEYFRKVAEENILRANSLKEGVKAKVDLSGLKEDPKKVAAAAQAAAKKKAEKEGKVAPPPKAKAKGQSARA
jgi:hypothetical protein